MALSTQPVSLSQLIDLVNERFGTDFNQADQLFFDQIVEAAMADDDLRQAAAVNPSDKFELVFTNLLENLFVERMDQNEKIFVQVMNNLSLKKFITTEMAAAAYTRLRHGAGGESMAVASKGEVTGTPRQLTSARASVGRAIAAARRARVAYQTHGNMHAIAIMLRSTITVAGGRPCNASF